jgi:hypothetical protein
VEPDDPRGAHLWIDISSNEGVRQLAEQPTSLLEAEVLFLSGPKITDTSARHADGFAKFSKLTDVNLFDTGMKDSGPALFSKCEKLEGLCINGCGQLTDDALRELKQFKHLKRLFLVAEGRGKLILTDASMTHVARIEQLEQLYIIRVPVTDAGLLRLKTLQNLRKLCLRATSVTPEGVEQLQQALPKCEIHFQ